MQRLTALDAAFLDLKRTRSANVAWFSVFEGPAPDHGELVRYIEGKLALVPRYRQKLRFLPLGIADRCGSTTPTSIWTITSAGPRCRRRAARNSSPDCLLGWSPSSSTEAIHCGRCG